MNEAGPAAATVRRIQRLLDENTATANRLDLLSGELMLKSMGEKGDKAAAVKAAEYRDQAHAARAAYADLATALAPALAAAARERAEGEIEQRSGWYTRAWKIATARHAAAQQVDNAVTALAASILLHDALVALAHQAGQHAIGEESSRLVTRSCVNSVLGQLVRHQALPFDMLPDDFTGEITWVHLVTRDSQAHLAALKRHEPPPLALPPPTLPATAV